MHPQDAQLLHPPHPPQLVQLLQGPQLVQAPHVLQLPQLLHVLQLVHPQVQLEQLVQLWQLVQLSQFRIKGAILEFSAIEEADCIRAGEVISRRSKTSGTRASDRAAVSIGTATDRRGIELSFR